MRSMAVVGLLCFFVRAASALVSPMPGWADRLHMGGSGAVRYMDGRARAQLERNGGILLNQAGLVLDVDLADNVSFWYDVNLIREGVNRTGKLSDRSNHEQVYVRWDNILGRSWLNAKLGRTFMPFGEEYLRWNAVDNPLASWSVSFPWGLDEGLLLFGPVLPGDLLSYALAVHNGGRDFNLDDNANKTLSAKLSSSPFPWLYASASYLNLGKQGNATGEGYTEFWLSGFGVEHLEHFHVPGQNGEIVGSPSNMVAGQGFELDARLSHDWGQLWVNHGRLHIQDGGGSFYDRDIRWYTTELLGYLPRTEKKAYLVGRYSIIGTFDPVRGYRFAGTELADNALGNNSAPYADEANAGRNWRDQRALWRYSLGAGWRLHDNMSLKLEYSWEDTHLTEPARASTEVRVPRGKYDFLVAELAFKF